MEGRDWNNGGGGHVDGFKVKHKGGEGGVKDRLVFSILYLEEQ